MQDINFQLRAAYYSLLAGNISIGDKIVPIYYIQAPAGTAATPVPNCYIIFNPTVNTGFQDFKRDHTLTNFNLLIVTKYPNNNSGADCDSIANQIFNIIQPNPVNQTVQITNGEVITTTTTQDRTFGNLTDGLNKIVNRTITFTHKIMHYTQSETGGNVFYFVQNDTGDPTDWTNAISANPAAPFSINFGSQPNPKIFGIAYLNSYAVKTNYKDVNDADNAGNIGAETDLFATRVISHGGNDYIFIYTQYLTGFNGPFAGVKFF